MIENTFLKFCKEDWKFWGEKNTKDGIKDKIYRKIFEKLIDSN